MLDQERCAVIQQLPILAPLDPVLRDRIVALWSEACEGQRLDPDEVLMREGEIGGSSGFILASGKVRVCREGASPVLVEAPAILGEMHQFNPHGLRTATVQADGPAEVLRFTWLDFYRRARTGLAPEEESAIIDMLEHSAWDRSESASVLELPLFQDLPQRLRLRICLLLQWIAHHETPADGEVLFEEGSIHGDTVYLLTHGRVQLGLPSAGGRILEAPDIFGVVPDFKPDRAWSVTARSLGRTELLKFTWLDLVRRAERRLERADFDRFQQAVAARLDEHFGS